MVPVDHCYFISIPSNRDKVARYTGVGGYSLYREPEGYVYWWQQSGTIPIYQYRHLSSGDHYYNTDGKFVAGYASEGIAWYMYPNQVAGTVPLCQFWGNGDHFYTTDPDGEMVSHAKEGELVTISKPLMSGYQRDAVGILGYLWPNQQTGTDPLMRLFQQNAEGYTLDGTTLKTRLWNAKTNEMRESKLDLTQVLKINDKILDFVKVPTNLDKVSTYIEERNGANLERIYDGGDGGLTLALGGASRIHARLFVKRNLIPDDETTSWVELEPYLRRTYDGHLEWMYPTPPEMSAFWDRVADVGKFIQPAMDSEYDPVTEASKAIMDYLNHRDIDEPNVENFLENCYIENDRVIRRATQVPVTVPNYLRHVDMSEDELQRERQRAMKEAENMILNSDFDVPI